MNIINFKKIIIIFTITLLLCELVFRVIDGVPLLSIQNQIKRRIDLLAIHTATAYDEKVGWILKPNMKSRDKLGINTGEYGIRSNNNEGNVQISEGNILAVGDSFTAGSEVGDTESWPAHLEKLLKKPVYNAAAGGWGPDQIVLRAEDLSEKIKPELIIISFMDQLIPRASYSVYGGGSKPYYTIQNEELIEHNIPVVPYSELGSGANLNLFKSIFGYSSFVNKVITATPWSNRWWDPRVFKKNEVDEVLISCLLLERIHKSSKPKNIKIIFLLQYGGPTVEQFNEEPDFTKQLVSCIKNKTDIIIVDSWTKLKELQTTNKLNEFFVMQDKKMYGHMNSKGNQLMATLINDVMNN